MLKYINFDEVKNATTLMFGSALRKDDPNDYDILMINDKRKTRCYIAEEKLDINYYNFNDIIRLYQFPEHWLMNFEYECGKITNGVYLTGRKKMLENIKKQFVSEDAWFRIGLVIIRLGNLIDVENKIQKSQSRLEINFLIGKLERYLRLILGIILSVYPNSYYSVFYELNDIHLKNEAHAVKLYALNYLKSNGIKEIEKLMFSQANSIITHGLTYLEDNRPTNEMCKKTLFPN